MKQIDWLNPIEILFGLRDRYEKHHQLKIGDDAISAAANYAHQYISDRFLPDKAIDLIDEAGSRVRLLNSRLPAAAQELDKELRHILRIKDEAIRGQDYEKAEQHRNREVEIKAQIAAIAQSKKDQPTAKLEELIVTDGEVRF